MNFTEDLDNITILGILLGLGIVGYIIYEVLQGNFPSSTWLCSTFNIGCPSTPGPSNPYGNIPGTNIAQVSPPSQSGAITEGGATGLIANFDQWIDNIGTELSGETSSSNTPTSGGSAF